MRLVFLGTPDFAVPSLERTVSAGHEVAAVFTQPDRPKGRGQQLQSPPIKLAALRLGLPVHQPGRVRRPEVIEQLRALAPEAMVAVGYGQILPQAILDIPEMGVLNVHASLLPRFRGAAPVQWAIARGETRTGVTIMHLDAGLDTGPMLLKWETEIGEEEMAVDLSSRLATAGAVLLVRVLAELPALHPEPQDNSQATYAPILKKEDGHINWSMTAREVLNRIRGFQPWPGCYAFLRGRRVHVWKARTADCALATGQLRARERRLYAGCADSAIELLEVQWEGKKRMEAAAFLNGFPIESDEALA